MDDRERLITILRLSGAFGLFGLGVIFLGYGAVRLSADTKAERGIDRSFGPETSIEPVVLESPRPEPVVEIAGAVKKPGVYRLEEGDRVADLVDRAGGLDDSVDTAKMMTVVNLARKLSDEEKVIIPVQGYQSESEYGNLSGTPEGASDKTAININTAGQSDLESIAGIGPKRAASIIAGRPYDHLIDLVDKGVIGESLFESIKADLTVK